MIVRCWIICRRISKLSYRTLRILFDPSTTNGEELPGLWNDCTRPEDLEAILCHRSLPRPAIFKLSCSPRRTTGALSTFRFHPGEPSNFISTFFLDAWNLRLARRWIAIKSDFQMFGKVSLPWKFQWFRGNFARDDSIPPATAVVRNFDSLLPRWHDEFISPF